MKKVSILFILLFQGFIVLAQFDVDRLRLGFGVNKSLTFPSGNYAFEQQFFQPKITVGADFSTFIRKMDLAITMTFEKLNYARPFLYPSGYGTTSYWGSLPEQVLYSSHLIGLNFGANYKLIESKKWSLTMYFMGGYIIGPHYMVRERFDNEHFIPSELVEKRSFSALNVGASATIGYKLSENYTLGFDVGINQYYNKHLRNINRYLGIPTPNNFQIILTKTLNH
ncbi:hypothetical protein GC194_08735 [bacterium]|nr:hypothetical protein [bacterium]